MRARVCDCYFFHTKCLLKCFLCCWCWIKQVADFGLSREEVVDKQAAIRGTFGYLDPEYISSGTFTKKSDVYSFGVLLFELIAGRNPQQGLMEYVELVRSLSMPPSVPDMKLFHHSINITMHFFVVVELWSGSNEQWGESWLGGDSWF